MSKPTLFAYKKTLAKHLKTSTEQLTLYWKGRVGLYGLLRALDIKRGDEVILPAFTCVVVANAILYCEATPVYIDIDPRTYNMNPDLLAQKVSSHTRLIIAQNTFGLSSDVQAIADFAKARGIAVIEDCTHGFGGTYQGQPNGTLTQAAFFSSQWNKPFSTGIGGFVLCNEPGLAKKLQEFEQSLLVPSAREAFLLKVQYFARRYFMTPRFYWSALRLYRWLSRKGILTGSSAGIELEGTTMPSDFLKTSSPAQAGKGIQELARFEANLAQRKQIAARYDRCFEAMQLPKVFVPDYATHTYVYYPFLVKDREAFRPLAEQNQIPLNDWMNSPLHPVQEGWEKWQYPYGENPVGESISQHILNLPTTISLDEAEKICQFLRKYQEKLGGETA